MTMMKISHESSILALQVGAPPVMSCDLSTEIWLLKEDLLSTHLLGMYLCHSYGLSIILSMVHVLVFTGPLNSFWMGGYDQFY